MGSHLTEVTGLLKLKFPTMSIYRNFIPEGVTKPALVVTEIANSNKRVLSGDKYGNSTNWRVAVHVISIADMKPILEKLEELDNTSNDDFQRIFADYVLTETKQSGQIFTRAFYDLSLYK